MSDLDLDSLSELEERCLVNGGLTDAEIRDVFSLAREARRLREVERNIRFYANSIEDTLRNRPSLPPASPWGDGYNEACNHVIRELRDIVGVKPVVSTEETP